MEDQEKKSYLTVTALTRYIKQKFVRDPYLKTVYLVGEVSNFRFRPQGHQYFRIKDDQAAINVVMFKRQFEKVPFKLEEGMQVFVKGSLSVYEASGSYQFYIDDIQPDGVGALYQALEDLKKEFQAAGLFDQLQRPLPSYPQRIAVITSPSGAVIKDIHTTINRRFPLPLIYLFESRVQGKEAVGDLVSAFNRVKADPRHFDVLILARGGGSIEDLWPFNDRLVAQAILDCPVPVISSVGHETDTTIADLVADVRAATPTAAAELAVPVLNDLLTRIQENQIRLNQTMNHQIRLRQDRMSHIIDSYVFSQPDRLYHAYSQRLDIASERLNFFWGRYLSQKKENYQRLNQNIKLKDLRLKMNRQAEVLNQVQKDLNVYTLNGIKGYKQDLVRQVDLLSAHSPLQIMAKGYALITKGDQLVKSVADLKVRDSVNIQMKDGLVRVSVEEKEFNDDFGEITGNQGGLNHDRIK